MNILPLPNMRRTPCSRIDSDYMVLRITDYEGATGHQGPSTQAPSSGIAGCRLVSPSGCTRDQIHGAQSVTGYHCHQITVDYWRIQDNRILGSGILPFIKPGKDSPV